MKNPPSIRRRLLSMLLSAFVMVWLLVLLLVYRAAQHEVEEVFDAGLARSAHVLQTLLLHEAGEQQEIANKARAVRAEIGADRLAGLPGVADIVTRYVDERGREQLELAGLADADGVGHRYGAGLTFVARFGDGSVMLRGRDAPDIPRGADGYSDLQSDGNTWRIFTVSHPSSGFLVQVGERQAFRNELVRHITRNTLMPMLLALPLLGVLVWILVGRALAPLQRVAEQVALRAPTALDAIESSDAPREVGGLIAALNALFGRVAKAMHRERQFTADAAHELRTPLAAMKTHLQVARAATQEPVTRHSIDQVLSGVRRATHSVEQLLLLARADAQEARTLVDASVDLREVALGVVGALSQQAFEGGVDLGLDAATAVVVRGDPTALHLMLRNLVDNAVRYTPPGGTVTVSVGGTADGAWLAVADNGPGVPPDQHERIFDRFHRGAEEQAATTVGSGLGLSIVQRIAELHGATIHLGGGLDGRGLGVRVQFARA